MVARTPLRILTQEATLCRTGCNLLRKGLKDKELEDDVVPADDTACAR